MSNVRMNEQKIYIFQRMSLRLVLYNFTRYRGTRILLLLICVRAISHCRICKLGGWNGNFIETEEEKKNRAKMVYVVTRCLCDPREKSLHFD